MPTKLQLLDELDQVQGDLVKVQADLQASEETVVNQIDHARSLEAKLRGQAHSVTDLKDQNKKMRDNSVKSVETISVMNSAIKEYQQTIHELRKGYAEYQNTVIEAEAALELGLQLFYPESLADPDSAKDPKARLILRVFDILGKEDE